MEKLKFYIQRQFNLAGGMAGTFGEMNLYNFGKLHTKHKKVWYDAQSTEVFPCRIF